MSIFVGFWFGFVVAGFAVKGGGCAAVAGPLPPAEEEEAASCGDTGATAAAFASAGAGFKFTFFVVGAAAGKCGVSATGTAGGGAAERSAVRREAW